MSDKIDRSKMAESIPIGFRFLPTDREMLVYLESLILINDDDQNQLRKDAVYYDFIRWATLYDRKPWELYKDDGYDQDEEGSDGNDLYFLTSLKKFQNGSRHARTVKTTLSSGEEETIGTWKFQTGPTYIIDYKTRKPLGVKREATFIPNMTEDNEDDQDAGTSCRSSSSSKKRKNAPEEMQGIRYIMHEYCLNPCDDQVYSLCRIRRKINKKNIIINKKMRRSSSPTTNTTTASTIVQPVQEERAAGYDYHQQEINSICYNDGLQQQQQVLLPEGEVQISDGDKGLANAMEADIVYRGVVLNEEFLSLLEQDAEAAAAARAAATGGDNIFYNNGQQQQMAGYEHDQQEINSICYNGGQQQQQQQEAVLPPEGDVQIIPDDVNGLADVAEIMELWGVELNEDFLSRLEQEEAATAGGDNIFYNNGQQQQQMMGYEHDNQYHHQEVMYGDFVLNYEQEQHQQQSVVVPAEETATGVSSEITHHHKDKNIDVLLEADDQILDDDDKRFTQLIREYGALISTSS